MDKRDETTLHPELAPLMRRAGEAVAKLRARRDGVVAVELSGDGGDEFFFSTSGTGEMVRGRPPQGMAHVLHVRGDARALHHALVHARNPGELIALSGLEVRGSVDAANQLVPHLLRILAEARRVPPGKGPEKGRE